VNEFQFWIMLSAVFGLLAGGIGWVITWLRSHDKRIEAMEIAVAVIKAIMEERKP
jgi:hypothetical protein